METKYSTDIAVRLTFFYLKIIGFWFARSRLQLWFRHLMVIYTFIMNMFTMWLQCMGIYHFWGDFTMCTYILVNVSVNIGKNESERVLLFHMWLDLPVSMSPYFEIMYVLQVLSLCQCNIGFTCFDNIFCIMCLHAAGQFRILQYRLKNMREMAGIQEDNLKSASYFSSKYFMVFKNCVRQHQMVIAFCTLFEEVFSAIVLCQVIMFSMLVCLLGYQLFLVDLNLPMLVSLISFISANLCQLWVFTYSCDTMTRESLNVGTAMYTAPWLQLPTDKFGKMIRKDLQIVIMRSRRGCHITACGFFPISLETYTSIMSTAMSYFTLLKGTTVDVET
nr:PREDICTED: odorant receptor Or2-like [Megachile rotundata]